MDVDDDLNSPARLAWEKQLLRRATAGDRSAIGELYTAYASPLYRRVLLPKLGNPTAAEDALSETFRTALERLGDFTPRGTSVYFWLARIASNKAIDLHRARAVTGRALVNFEHLLGTLGEAPAGPDALLDSHRERSRLTRDVGTALQSLNERYARAIQLRFLEGRSREDCATALDVKLGTFDVVLLRALRAFRKNWPPMTTLPEPDA